MSMACLYLLGKCDCSCGRQFPKFQFDLQRKQRSLSLLIDLFRKAEMLVKRQLFWQAGEDFKMFEVFAIICRYSNAVSIKV